MVKIPCRRNSQVNLRFLTDGKDRSLSFFFTGKKNQKPRRSKNSLNRFYFRYLPRLISRLEVFHQHHFLALWPKSGRPVCSDNLERLDLPPRGDF